MLNIVLGPTLGLDVAVVGFFGDYLDLEQHRDGENNTREEGWLELSYGSHTPTRWMDGQTAGQTAVLEFQLNSKD